MLRYSTLLSALFLVSAFGAGSLLFSGCKSVNPAASATKELVAIGPNGLVFGIYRSGQQIIARQCPDLTIITSAAEIEAKCSNGTKKTFALDEFKNRLKGMFWVAEVRKAAESSEYNKMLDHRPDALENLSEHRAKIHAKVEQIEAFLSRFPGTADKHERELDLMRQELAGNDDLTRVVDAFNKIVSQTVDQVMDETQVFYLTSNQDGNSVIISMLQSLFQESPYREHSKARLTRYDEGHFDAQANVPTALPDGRVAYRTNFFRRKFELWIINPQTKQKERLTANDEGHGNVAAIDPAAFPDGKVVYSTDLSKKNMYELWVVDRQSKKKERLTRYDEAHGSVTSIDPAVLADGRIVYSTDISGKGEFELWIIDPRSKEKVRLTRFDEAHGNVGSYDPAVLPDGRIVYSTDLTKRWASELWIIDPRTKQKERLTHYDEAHGSVDSYDPAVLPDGRIVYSTDLSSDEAFELWIIDPQTKEKERLTRYDEAHGRVSSKDPAVLPDGRIVYSTDISKKNVYELWIIHPK